MATCNSDLCVYYCANKPRRPGVFRSAIRRCGCSKAYPGYFVFPRFSTRIFARCLTALSLSLQGSIDPPDPCHAALPAHRISCSGSVVHCHCHHGHATSPVVSQPCPCPFKVPLTRPIRVIPLYPPIPSRAQDPSVTILFPMCHATCRVSPWPVFHHGRTVYRVPCPMGRGKKGVGFIASAYHSPLSIHLF